MSVEGIPQSIQVDKINHPQQPRPGSSYGLTFSLFTALFTFQIGMVYLLHEMLTKHMTLFTKDENQSKTV